MASRSKKVEPEPIKRMYLRGSQELGAATGIYDSETHARWRNEGLPYILQGNVYLYKPTMVEKFLDGKIERIERKIKL